VHGLAGAERPSPPPHAAELDPGAAREGSRLIILIGLSKGIDTRVTALATIAYGGT
jgi:hypothetical protein